MKPKPIGEIVEASTVQLKAIARVAFEPPPFGAFVKSDAQGRTTYAVVSLVHHTPLDPSRRAVPLGLTWDELEREQPQVLDLLVTEFDALIVAFAEGGAVRPYLPPAPPRVHDFVEACATDEVRALTKDLSFVRTLAATATQPSEELVAAAIRAGAEAHEGSRAFLVRAGREVADLYRQDYERARAVLRRVGLGGS